MLLEIAASAENLISVSEMAHDYDHIEAKLHNYQKLRSKIITLPSKFRAPGLANLMKLMQVDTVICASLNKNNDQLKHNT